LCVALPRYYVANPPAIPTDTVTLDGVICLGHSDPLDPGGRPKVCFWDNQRDDRAFSFPRGSDQSISQWAGGAELVNGSGGQCTNCHAGENPYIVHGPVLGGLGPLAMPPNWLRYGNVTATGWVIGVVVGFALAVLMARYRIAERAMLPWIVLSQTVPLIAIAPLVRRWGSQIHIFGSTWSSENSVSVIAAYLAFFPVAIGALRGLRSLDATHVDPGRPN